MSNFLLQCSARKLSNNACYKFQNLLNNKFIKNLNNLHGIASNHPKNDDDELDISFEGLTTKFLSEQNTADKKKYWLQIINYLELFIKNLNGQLQIEHKDAFLSLSKLRVIKIIEYYRDSKTIANFVPLDFSCCVPAYIRYLGDMWFYKQIYIYLTGDNNLTDSGFKNYIKFWELVSKQGIKVFISSTLLGWVAYNDCIPDYALSPMHKLANWKAGHGLNGSLFTGDVAFEILLTPSTIHHVYGYLDMRDFKKGQLNIKEPEINFSAGFVGLKERAEYFVNTIIPNAAERATYKTQKLDTTQNDYQDFELDL